MEIKRSRHEKLDFIVECNEITTQFRGLRERLKTLDEKNEILRGYIETLKEFAEIQNALDHQEYFDKERIALYGFPQPTANQEESVSTVNANKDDGYQTNGKGILMPGGGVGLTLVNNCLSCSGQHAVRLRK